MLRTKNLSNQKIIIFITFICAALMSSVFIYHSAQKPQNLIPADQGFIFPAPRNISPFTLVTKNNEPFTEKNLQGAWTLMFFGFTHCSSICPNALNVLKQIYQQLHTKYPKLQVVFVSIDPSRDSITTLQQYLENFNPHFVGVTGRIDALRKLQAQLGIYAEPEKNQGSNYQVQHTSSILLINPNSKWAGVYKYDVPADALIHNIEKAMMTG